MPSSVTISKIDWVPYDPPLEEQMELLGTIVAIMRAERAKWMRSPLTPGLPPDKMESTTIQEGVADD